MDSTKRIACHAGTWEFFGGGPWSRWKASLLMMRRWGRQVQVQSYLSRIPFEFSKSRNSADPSTHRVARTWPSNDRPVCVPMSCTDNVTTSIHSPTSASMPSPRHPGASGATRPVRLRSIPDRCARARSSPITCVRLWLRFSFVVVCRPRMASMGLCLRLRTWS
ncbi:uncharacterized protein B0H18DRAFT_264696 [Fomitopsis serialis]|uniref:uncharacterized protein n=1 Tax=Fomitopsis serialis TaxID=139415 RepID=UPI002008D3EF|nr:uncharacterized protein B0H18DRAFT_264696 [Neoantrodia serialis]KAH9928178.1 hypothetical protein B0H18DRAFT_264696 [Neoantrodia serialis]